MNEMKNRKGSLKPISVIIKLRGGNKAVTIMANYEPFGLTAEQLGVDLKKLCAGATSGEFISSFISTHSNPVITHSTPCSPTRACKELRLGGRRSRKASSDHHFMARREERLA